MPRHPRLFAAILVLGAVSVSRAYAPAASAPQAEPPKAALRSVTVFPTSVVLDGTRAEQRLGLLGDYADGRSWELTRQASYRSSAEKIATVDAQGIVRPVANGKAEIVAIVQGQTVKVTVTVKGMKDETPVSFSREVLPILTRTGCNQGACHGAALGRGGFRLSLLGFDPLFDHGQIVQSAEGRRVVLSDPDRSILLLKPTLALEHAGGERFGSRSREYETFKHGWRMAPRPRPSAIRR